MSLVDQTKPDWTMYVSPSAELVAVGPRQPSPNPEHDLFESSLVELADIFGIEVDYYPLNPNYFDKVYGENQNTKYYGPFTTKVIYQPSVEETGLYQIWGMTSDEVIETIMIPQYTYWRDVKTDTAPQEGDVIRVKWNISEMTSGLHDIFYEITGVDDSANTFLLRKFSYDLKAKPMRFTDTDNVVVQDSFDPVTHTSDAFPVSAGSDNEAFNDEHEKIDAYDDLPGIDDLYGYK